MVSSDAEDQDGLQPRGTKTQKSCRTASSARNDVGQVGTWRSSSVLSIIIELLGNNYDICLASSPHGWPVSAVGDVTAQRAHMAHSTATFRQKPAPALSSPSSWGRQESTLCRGEANEH